MFGFKKKADDGAELRPTVWTTKGTMFVDELDYSVEREDEKDQVIIRPTYKLKSTGEVVRNDVHVIPLAPWQTGEGGRIQQMWLQATAADLG